ncbi:MAG: HU family DNA-binding protein [Bacteroides sp.]|nr:HU family DNA-binding protein [Bacteroides sp.]
MSIIYKKTWRENPQNRDIKKYHPQLITLGNSVDEDYIAHQIKELSSLSKGDIHSVITNFLDVMRTSLYSGHSVNFRNFGVFSMSAQTEGADTKEECTARNIKSIRINFRASKSIRPDVNAIRADDKISFVDLDVYLRNMSVIYVPDEDNKGDDGEDNGIHPLA